MVKVKKHTVRSSIKKRKRTTTSKSANVKIKNATKVNHEGVEFQSLLERSMYNKLTEAGFSYGKDFFYEAGKAELIEAFEIDNEIWMHKNLSKEFKLENKKVRSMNYTPDFSSDPDLSKCEWIIECKGRPNDRWPVVYKLFKLWLKNNNPDCKFYVPSSAKECLLVIEKIKYGNEKKDNSIN
jgi:hypothetical protein